MGVRIALFLLLSVSDERSSQVKDLGIRRVRDRDGKDAVRGSHGKAMFHIFLSLR